MPHPACALFAIEKPATLSTSAASKDRIGIFIDFPLGVDGLNARPAIASVGRGAPLGSAAAGYGLRLLTCREDAAASRCVYARWTTVSWGRLSLATTRSTVAR